MGDIAAIAPSRQPATTAMLWLLLFLSSVCTVTVQAAASGKLRCDELSDGLHTCWQLQRSECLHCGLEELGRLEKYIVCMKIACSRVGACVSGVSADANVEADSYCSSTGWGIGPCPGTGEIFLRTTLVEMGIHRAGSFGTVGNAPASFQASKIPDKRLGFMADYDKNGWSAGTPGYSGDYLVPGSPVEGMCFPTCFNLAPELRTRPSATSAWRSRRVYRPIDAGRHDVQIHQQGSGRLPSGSCLIHAQ